MCVHPRKRAREIGPLARGEASCKQHRKNWFCVAALTLHICLLFFFSPSPRVRGRPPTLYAELPMSSSGPLPALGAHHTRSTPLQVIHVLGNFMRIWSVYSLYSYLSNSGDSIVGFIFSCLVPTSIIFLVLQKPWKGRPLPNSQVVPTVVNGGILAFYFVLWGKGLLACGPLIALLAEYAGAVLGVLSAALYGRKVNIWKKASS